MPSRAETNSKAAQVSQLDNLLHAAMRCVSAGPVLLLLLLLLLLLHPVRSPFPPLLFLSPVISRVVLVF